MNKNVEKCIPMPEFDTSHYNIFSGRGVANILIGTLLFTIFLSIFYFTYIGKVEGEIVTEQVNNTVKELLESLKESGIDLSSLKSILNNMNPPKMDEEDNFVKNKNQELIKLTIKVLTISTILVIICVVLLKLTTNFSILEIVIINAIIIFFVAVTEYFFINNIPRNYRSLDPNRVKKAIINQLRNF